MITPGQRTPIVIATKPVDFRRGHDGLAATVQNELGLDPHSGLTVIFRSKRGDRVKILVWDGTGLVLVYKRLDEGRFACPIMVIAALAVFIGHWIDLYLAIMPGAVGHEEAGIGILEIGLTLGYVGIFLFTVFTALTKASLVPQNHPYFKESLEYDNI